MSLTENKELLTKVFSVASLLEQGGNMKNTIYCFGRTAFIINGDNTLILKFSLPDRIEFKQPISFRANDYEQGKFYEKDGKIYFQNTKQDAEFERTKSCRTPHLTFNDVEEIWNKLYTKPNSFFLIHRKTLELLDVDLSHIEFKAENKSLIITQRDIFSGTIITLTRKNRKKSGGLGAYNPDSNISADFEPIGIRTNDFSALFHFVTNLYKEHQIQFGINETLGYMTIKAGHTDFPMEGLMAWCVYDELGTVGVIGDGGRKEQEKGETQQGFGRKPQNTPPKTPGRRKVQT